MGAESIGAAVGFVVGGPLGAAAGFTAGAQHENLSEMRKMRRAQENLENERRQQLKNEAAAREEAAARAATAGQRVGRSALVGASNYGFGSGNSSSGLGQGNLFGN